MYVYTHNSYRYRNVSQSVCKHSLVIYYPWNEIQKKKEEKKKKHKANEIQIKSIHKVKKTKKKKNK